MNVSNEPEEISTSSYTSVICTLSEENDVYKRVRVLIPHLKILVKGSFVRAKRLRIFTPKYLFRVKWVKYEKTGYLYP